MIVQHNTKPSVAYLAYKAAVAVFLALSVFLSIWTLRHSFLLPTEHRQYTQIEIHPQFTISDQMPFLFLNNSRYNQVSLQYDIFYQDAKIYSSTLISPGDVESVNLLDIFDDGTYQILFSINSYNLENGQNLISNLLLEQTLEVIHETSASVS